MDKSGQDKLVEGRNLCKYYSQDDKITRALEEITISFYRGEFVALTGESGSGKSTLLNILCGYLPFDEGELYIEGKSCLGLSAQEWMEKRRLQLGYVSQEVKLLDSYTVYENLVAAVIHRCGDDLEEQADEILELVGLREYKESKAKRLSAGQRQRLAIARTLMMGAEILIVDEPTANLDQENAMAIMRLFQKVARDKLVIMASHDHALCKEYADRFITLHDGRIISDESSRDSQKAQKEILKGVARDTDSRRRAIRFFWKANLTGKKGSVLIRGLLFLAVFCALYVTLGQLLLCRDDRIARKSNKNYFLTQDDNRLLVSPKNGNALTGADKKRINKIANVTGVEFYGLLHEVHYKVVTREIQGHIQNASERGDKTVIQGSMPETTEEVLVSEKNGLKAGDEIQCEFSSVPYWGRQAEFPYTFKVAGVCRENDVGVYFSDAFCEMLVQTIQGEEIQAEYGWDETNHQYQGIFSAVALLDENFDDTKQVLISGEYQIPAEVQNKTGKKEFDGDEVLQQNDQVLDVTFSSNRHTGSDYFIYVDDALFRTLYPDYGKHRSEEMSVYMTSYWKTDAVIRKLGEMGYDAVSTYRVSRTEYDEKLVQQRTQYIMTCVGITIFLCILESILEYLLFGFGKKEDLLLLELCMNDRQLFWIKLLENMTIFLGAYLIFHACAACIFRVIPADSRIIELRASYTLTGYGLLFVLPCLCVWLPLKIYIRQQKNRKDREIRYDQSGKHTKTIS